MNIIALDIHKRETQACIMDSKGRVVLEKRFATAQDVYRKELRRFKGPAVIEAVGFHRPVAEWLQELDHQVHLANTARIPKPAVKTDKKDAKHLAQLFHAGILPEAYLAPPEWQRARDLVRHRQFLGQQSRQLKAKVKHDLYKHGHFVDANPIETTAGRRWLQHLEHVEIRSTVTLYEALKKEINAAQKEIEARLEEFPDARRLMTIPGVGSYTALLVVAEAGDMRRFRDKDALASYAGLAVRQSQSGDVDIRGSITKQGNPTLRWAAVECARNHVRYCKDSRLSNRYHRLASKKGHKKAITATARVLLTVMYTMIQNQEDFRLDPL